MKKKGCLQSYNKTLLKLINSFWFASVIHQVCVILRCVQRGEPLLLLKEYLQMGFNLLCPLSPEFPTPKVLFGVWES